LIEQTPEEKALWDNFIDVLRNGVKPGKWLLVSTDNFDYTSTVVGQFDTEAEVIAAAKLKIKELPDYETNSIQTSYASQSPEGKIRHISLKDVGLRLEQRLVSVE